ncbi:uncharacterized protein [Apostichopus japonicus]|uniref:uncharacterized protein isoform X2 n=1 Tax=Stichopus japonicus TaxID=307972 RepID=UPI003AB470B9
MKRRAVDTEVRTRNVVARGIANLSPQACAQLPGIDVMSRDVRCQRQTNDPPVPAPDDKLFDIRDEFRSTNDGRLFLRYENGRDDRILLFATQRSMDFLSTCHHWFMDGTFKSSPPQFAQIYTVHGLRRGRNIPTAYALLPNKREETYVELLRQVQQLTLVAPTSVLTDFEVGAMNAIKTVYPEANVQGCLFHLCQSIHRRVQSEGLQDEYINDNVFRSQVRLLAPLAFVPGAEVEDAFEHVSNRWGNHGRAILDYFERVYVGQVRAGVRHSPLFDLNM